MIIIDDLSFSIEETIDDCVDDSIIHRGFFVPRSKRSAGFPSNFNECHVSFITATALIDGNSSEELIHLIFIVLSSYVFYLQFVSM